MTARRGRERDEQRRAKRDAWWRAAGLVQSCLDAGFVWEDAYPDPVHRRRVQVAMREVIAEMEARGHK